MVVLALLVDPEVSELKKCRTTLNKLLNFISFG